MNARRRLTAMLRPVAASMTTSIVARMVQLSAGLFLVAAGGWAAAALAEGTLESPWIVAAVLAGTALIKAVARYLEQYRGHDVAFGLLSSMRTEFFRRVEPLAPAALADTRSGDLVERVMSDVDRVEVFFAHTVAPTVAGVAVPALTVAGLAWWAEPGLAAVVGVAMLLVGWIVPWLANRSARESARIAGSVSGELAAHTTDGVQGLADAVIFAYGPRRSQEMDDRARRLADAEARVARIDGIRTGLNQLVVGATVVGMAILGGGLVERGLLELPVLAGTVAVTLVTFGPLRDIQAVKPAYDRAMAAADRIFEVTDRSPQVTEPADPHPEGPDPVLRFRHVTFRYPGRAGGVRDLTLTVEPGSTLAIVGPSGAGKSTVARLAARFWDPDEGVITLGDDPLPTLHSSQIRRTVAIVTQQSHLFSGTVADNLRLGRPDASSREMERAARTAALHRDLAELPDGYATGVGELGVRLSGGQRQRIALARGLLADSPVLIVDEATSELDVDTEAEVLAGLREASQEKALLIVAHRLTTVVDADEILVMDSGAVVERGTHGELMDRGGLYRRLWARQLDEL